MATTSDFDREKMEEKIGQVIRRRGRFGSRGRDRSRIKRKTGTGKDAVAATKARH